MRPHHHPLALAIVSLAITAASLPATAYARKSLMEYGARHASLAHGRHAGSFHQQSAGNSNSSTGPAFSAFPGHGRGLMFGFGHGRAHAWLRPGGSRAGGYRPGAGVNADYLLITMRNGVKLRGNLLAQLAWSSGFALQPVMADSAGNYVVSVRGRRGSGSNDPTALLASIKTNPNVLDAAQAFMGQTRQLTAAPGASVSVAASDLIGSVTATGYQWSQLSGTPVQLAQPTDSTLALTLPQTTTSGTAGTTDSGTAAPTDSGAATAAPSLSANRYRLRPTGFRPSLMQTARQHGYGYHNGNGHGHRQAQLAFELIARDSADRAYIGKVVITVQPAVTAAPGGTGSTTGGGTDSSGSTSGTTDTSGDTGLTDPTTGTPLTVNPVTGAYIDPATGQDLQSDPVTGLPIDPATGQLIDPTTGQPIPNTSGTGNSGSVSTDPGSGGTAGSSGTTGSGGGVIDGSVSAA